MTLAFCVDVLVIASILGVVPALDAHLLVTRLIWLHAENVSLRDMDQLWFTSLVYFLCSVLLNTQRDDLEIVKQMSIARTKLTHFYGNLLCQTR